MERVTKVRATILVMLLVLVLGFLISWVLGDLPGRKAWFSNMRNRG